MKKIPVLLIFVSQLCLAVDDNQKDMAITSMSFHYWCMKENPPKSLYDLEFIETRENLDNYFGGFAKEWFSTVVYSREGETLIIKRKKSTSGNSSITSESRKQCEQTI